MLEKSLKVIKSLMSMKVNDYTFRKSIKIVIEYTLTFIDFFKVLIQYTITFIDFLKFLKSLNQIHHYFDRLF